MNLLFVSEELGQPLTHESNSGPSAGLCVSCGPEADALSTAPIARNAILSSNTYIYFIQKSFYTDWTFQTALRLHRLRESSYYSLLMRVGEEGT